MRFESEIAEFIAWIAEVKAQVVTMLSEQMPALPWPLPWSVPHLVELCALVLAIAVLLLCRRVRRDRKAMRGMVAEIDMQRDRIVALEGLRSGIEARFARLGSEIADMRGRQRAMEARVGKPDPKLATAMARAGTRSQHMVECGLSHGEVHLLQALNAARPSQAVEAPASASA